MGEPNVILSRAYHIYCRIFGYVFTLVMHVGNIVYMQSFHKGDILKDPVVSMFMGLQARYFTCWTFGLQMVYAVVGLICDYLTLKNSRRTDYRLPKYLKGFRDTLFAAIQWPSNLLVFSVFWGLYLYDRNLILPPILDQVLPTVSNHIIHTAIVPLVVWELMFQPRYEPRSHTRYHMHILGHFTLYFTVLFYTYYERGRWLYPVFEKFWGTIHFPIFSLTILLLLFIYYHIQWTLTRFIWGTRETRVSKLQ